jgi:hypothetical protein
MKFDITLSAKPDVFKTVFQLIRDVQDDDWFETEHDQIRLLKSINNSSAEAKALANEIINTFNAMHVHIDQKTQLYTIDTVDKDLIYRHAVDIDITDIIKLKYYNPEWEPYSIHPDLLTADDDLLSQLYLKAMAYNEIDRQFYSDKPEPYLDSFESYKEYIARQIEYDKTFDYEDELVQHFKPEHEEFNTPLLKLYDDAIAKTTKDLADFKKVEQDYIKSRTPYIAEKQPGRNEPCPCGSGKKYKKCCLKN